MAVFVEIFQKYLPDSLVEWLKRYIFAIENPCDSGRRDFSEKQFA